MIKKYERNYYSNYLFHITLMGLEIFHERLVDPWSFWSIHSWIQRILGHELFTEFNCTIKIDLIDRIDKWETLD